MSYEVTIGIPVYNVGQYIQRSLDSALAQTFANIEFLIVDDCGTDGSIDIVKKYQLSHPRGKDIYILTQPQNRGVSAARNRIIDEAKGKYLYFMDSDDLISENCIELLYSSITKHDAQIVYGSYERVEVDGSVRGGNKYPELCLFGKDALAEYAYRSLDGFQASVCNCLISLPFLRRINLRMINYNYWEDFVFTQDLVTYVDKAILLSDITYSYLCRESSLSNYQSRTNIRKQEVMNNVRTIEHLKHTTNMLYDKPYIGNRVYNIMLMDMYIVMDIIKKRNIIHPYITDKEIMDVMVFPVDFNRIIQFKRKRLGNFFFYAISKFPAFCLVALMKMIVRIKL